MIVAPSISLEGLQTEGRNPKTSNIDRVTTLELCHIINKEDATVIPAVERCLSVIAEAIDAIEPKIRKGGRLVYVGAGTSGRLGVLDASEIPPTFSAPSEQFVALIAGGDVALRHAQEGAEDDTTQAKADLEILNLDPDLDSVIGIAASGRTPYVLSCLSFAKARGCTTIGVACSYPSEMSSCETVDYMISAVTGPEIVTGSTRLKAGTATKMVLNMLSTGLMIKVGKTYGNMMVDLKATNKKLLQRSRNIVRTICGISSPGSDEEIDALLRTCNGSVKLAVATILLQTSVSDAAAHLKGSDNVLAAALSNIKSSLTGIIENGREHGQEYALCVDVGGSKCAAVLLGKNGEEGKGEASGCNVSSTPIEDMVASISAAIQQAVDSCSSTQGNPFISVNFKAIWIGLAGYDRPSIAETVNIALNRLFDRPVGKGLKISTDVDLLVAPLANEPQLDSAIVLVAGTGSVAMSYRRDEDQFHRTGRCGGWGHLLGDDGSGYAIGRAGLTVALGEIDEYNLSRQKHGAPLQKFDPLTEEILEYFDLDTKSGAKVDLLSQILSCNPSNNNQEATVKKRIASVARIVLDMSSSSKKANDIVQAGSHSLLQILKRLIQSQDLDPSKSALCLSGGLMQSEKYIQILQSNLKSVDINFSCIRRIKFPALDGARYLLRDT
ncbi:putative glucokinase regulator family protein [Xylogone sp. PMI_703]|nr:putative glucokinase regulator family protein [Xylogone sp. PMI_703]